MPAPELLDMEPLDEGPPKRRKKTSKKKSAAKSTSVEKAEETEDETDADDADRPRMKVGFAEVEDEGDLPKSRNKRRAAADDDVDDERESKRGARKTSAKSKRYDEDEDDDDSLFDEPPAKSRAKPRWRDDDVEGDEPPTKKRFSGRDEEDEPVEKGRRKSRRLVDDEDDDEVERRPFFARKRGQKDSRHGSEPVRESLRFADEDDDIDADFEADGYDERHDMGRDDERDNGAYIVDADWEDVEDADIDRPRGFGRRIRAERRRATALARMEDVRPLDPRSLDEEFFAALSVTPRELERAIRKARRRAEAREKNRLTPLRVFGWTAWAALVAGALYAMFIYRNEIVKVAPKTADAYAVIGIDANPYGLAIENVRHRLAMSTSGPTIEITGNLRNETEGGVTAPLLQAEALGARGELLARWTFAASETQVGQGEMVDFVTRAPAPEGVAEVALSFAPERSVIDNILPQGDE